MLMMPSCQCSCCAIGADASERRAAADVDAASGTVLVWQRDRKIVRTGAEVLDGASGRFSAAVRAAMTNDRTRCEGDVGATGEAGEALVRSRAARDDAVGRDVEFVASGIGTSGSTGDVDLRRR